MLHAHDVEVNVLCTLHAANADHPLDVYRFFRDELGARYLQFIPIIERATEADARARERRMERHDPAADGCSTRKPERLVTERSIGPEQYGDFLVAVFDEWIRRDVGTDVRPDVRRHARVAPRTCTACASTRRHAATRWRSSTTATCTHAITSSSPITCSATSTPRRWSSWSQSPKQRAFGQHKLDSLPRYCRECDVRFACHGGCPKDRFRDDA